MATIAFRERLSGEGGEYQTLKGGELAHDLRMRAAQSRQRARVVTRAKKKVGARTLSYELDYDEIWYINEYDKIIDRFLDYAHKVWAATGADRVGPLPQGTGGPFRLTITVEDVQDMGEREAGSRTDANERARNVQAAPAVNLAGETLPAFGLPGPLQRLKQQVKVPKQAIRTAFEEGLKERELVGWRGTPEENEHAVAEAAREAAECGLRLCYRNAGQLIPVTLAYRNGVFVLSRDGGGYLTSSKGWPELSVVPRETKVGKKRGAGKTRQKSENPG